MEIHLFAKGMGKKLAMEQGKSIWKVLVVHDRKYHLFLAPGAGRGKVGGGRKRVHLTEINATKFFFGWAGHPGAPRKLLPVSSVEVVARDLRTRGPMSL